MTKRLSIRDCGAILLLAGILAACSGSNLSGPMVRGKTTASRNAYCNMAEWKCDILRAGIQHDLDHANETCKAAGYSALARFEAPFASGDGYEEGYSATDWMWTVMQDAPTASGGAAVDGKVWVTSDLWTAGSTDPATIGSYLGHEEQHQNGNTYEHMTGVLDEAQKVQAACMNPQP